MRHLFIYLFLWTSLLALDSYVIEYQGKSLTLSKELPEVYLGAYTSIDKRMRSGFLRSKKRGKSYQVWLDQKRKRVFEWGVLVKDGKLYTLDGKKPLLKSYVLVRYFSPEIFQFGQLDLIKDGENLEEKIIFDNKFVRNSRVEIDE
jgi:hypothetical protein